MSLLAEESFHQDRASPPAHGPVVSIVVRNYNYARFLRDALESALAQTYPEIEIIVIDDGSSDESPAILAEYAARCRISLQSNQGEVGALNHGFALARGDLVLFLDADDVLAPDAVAAVAASWTPDVTRISFPMRVMTETGLLLDAQLPPKRPADLTAEQHFAQFGEMVSACQSANVYAASALRHILPIDVRAWPFPPDAYLNALTSASGRTIEMARPLGGYRLHRGNYTRLNMLDERRRAEIAQLHPALHRAVRRFVGEERWLGFRPVLPTFHWLHRLISLRTVPALHPFPDDHRGALLRQCLAAVRNKRGAGPAYKLLLGSGALTAAFLPSPLLRRLLPSFLTLVRVARHPTLYLPLTSSRRHWRHVYRLNR